MKNLILHFFLLILEVLFNFAQDIVYEYSQFSKALSKKRFEFVPGKKVDPVLFF